MDTGFGLALALAFAFALTNGFHDASNAIATLVATRAARPLQAVVLAAVFNVLGPLVVGAAVADTIGGIVTLEPTEAIRVIGAGLAAAVGWNVLTWWRGLPSSSGHALVGGLVARVLEGGVDAIRWGGLDGWHPVGVSARSSRSPSRRCSAQAALPGPRASLDGPRRDAAWTTERGPAMRNVGGARLQPRRQRRAEGGRRGRRAADRRGDRGLPATWARSPAPSR